MANQFIQIDKGVDIPWDIAKKLIGHYNEKDEKWKMPDDSILSGFRINISELLPVLLTNHPDQNVKELLIVLGYNDGNIDVNNNGKKDERTGFTAILMGVDDNQEIITTGHGKIQDYLDTVPPNTLKKIDSKDLHQWRIND